MDDEIQPDALAALLGAGSEGGTGDGGAANADADVDDGGDAHADADVDDGGDTHADANADADDHPNLRIVDIRSERAFDRGHLPTSESIPFPELTTRVPELTGADRIVTVCPHGISSRQAAQLIASYEGTTDARVESLHGGIDAWKKHGHELVATPDDDEPADEPDAPF